MSPEDHMCQYVGDNEYDDSREKRRVSRRFYGRYFLTRHGQSRSDPRLWTPTANNCRNWLPQQWRPPGCVFFMMPGHVFLLHGRAPCRSWGRCHDSMNGYCAEDEQSNREVNDALLTKTIRRNITVKMLETRKSRAISTAPVNKSSREMREIMLLRKRLQLR